MCEDDDCEECKKANVDEKYENDNGFYDEDSIHGNEEEVEIKQLVNDSEVINNVEVENTETVLIS